MLRHAVTAVGALAALALATASGAASGLPTGMRLHKPFTFTVTVPTAKSGPGVLRSMDGGSTWHRATVPEGSVRFFVNAPQQAVAGRITGLAVDPAARTAGPHCRSGACAVGFRGTVHRRHATIPTATDMIIDSFEPSRATYVPTTHRDLVTTLRRGTVMPRAHIATHVHVIRNNGGGTAGMFGRATRLRLR